MAAILYGEPSIAQTSYATSAEGLLLPSVGAVQSFVGPKLDDHVGGLGLVCGQASTGSVLPGRQLHDLPCRLAVLGRHRGLHNVQPIAIEKEGVIAEHPV